MYLTELSYHPGVPAFAKAIKAGGFLLEAHEHYQKQTDRNRCRILTAQGVQTLIVPICHTGQKQNITEVKIDNKQSWARTHWRSLCTAYNRSPYFEYYQPFFADIYRHPPETLFNLNERLLRTYLHCLRLPLPVSFTQTYALTPPAGCVEGRSQMLTTSGPDNMRAEPYVQVFGSSFAPLLSMPDLLFNVGPEAASYLGRAG